MPLPVPTDLPPSVFPEVLPPHAGAWLCVVDVEGMVRQWSVGGVDGWRDRFALGSVAKLVVALVVQSLEEHEQVRLDEPLLPGCPVTLRCLLRHTAGLPDVLPSSSLDLAQALSSRLLPPETAFSYSNLGFAVIGAWLVSRTGQPVSALAARHVFAPHAMDRASLRDDVLGAAGGLTATGEDVARLLKGLLRAPSLLKSLVTATVNVPGQPGLSAGLGCFRRVCGDTWLVEHEGFTGDAACVVCLAPEAGWGYAMLTKGWPYRLRRTRNQLESAWFGPLPAAEMPLRRLPAEAAVRYVGDYVNGPRHVRIVSRENGLHLERAGQRFPLVQAGEEHLAVAVPLRDRPPTIAVVTGADGCAVALYPFGSLRALCRSFG